MKHISSVLLLAALTACGGGGGDASGTSPAPTPTQPPSSGGPIAFTPARIDVKMTEGEDPEITLLAEATHDLPGKVNVAIVDTVGVFSSEMSIRAWNTHSYSAYLHTAKGLGAGIHEGTLTVKLCQDDAKICAQPHAGSPIALPYRVEVKSFGGTLSALAPDPAAAEWLTDKGDLRRTGYVNTSVNVSRLGPRFSWTAPDGSAAVVPVIQAGIAYVTTKKGMYAIDEQSGATRWRYTPANASSLTGVSRPAVSGTRVYASFDYNQYTNLDSVDSATGTFVRTLPSWKASMSTAPAVDGNLLVSKQDGGSLQAVDTSGQTYSVQLRGSSQWAVSAPPVIHGSAIYTYTGGGLYVLNRGNLAEIQRIEGSVAQLDFGADAMMLDDTHMAVIENDMYGNLAAATLTSFDIASAKIAWSVKGGFEQIAAAGKTIYAARNDRVAAIDAATGTELWSWPIPAGAPRKDDAATVYDLLATNNVLFVALANSVYAVDLATRTSVWSATVGGHLALSKNGVLYVADGKSPLRAFNVR